MTGSHEDELKLAFVLLDHLFKLLTADKFRTSLVIFKNQKIALVLMLLVKVLAQVLIIQYTVATEV